MTAKSTNPKPKSLWHDLPRRVFTICVGFPIVWKILSNSTLALVFFICVHGLVTWEYSILEQNKTIRASEKLLSLPYILIFSITSLTLAHIVQDSLFQFALCCIAGIFVWLDRRHWLLGLVVITIPFRTWYLISQDFSSTISILLVVWNCDTGALLFGRLSKKTGLPKVQVPYWIQKISPAKSVEGFVGGILGGVWTAVSWIPRLISWFDLETSSTFDKIWESTTNRVVLGLFMSMLAIFGDLVESAIKRQSNSKDSGSFLPGHGGILDRFDSSLFAVLFYSFVMDFVQTRGFSSYEAL